MWILNKVYVIGMGPGAYEQMTVAAVEALKGCDVIVGYTVYVDLMVFIHYLFVLASVFIMK